MLTSDRAYDCPCFYQRLASARLSAPSRYRASESEAGVESEAGGEAEEEECDATVDRRALQFSKEIIVARILPF